MQGATKLQFGLAAYHSTTLQGFLHSTCTEQTATMSPRPLTRSWNLPEQWVSSGESEWGLGSETWNKDYGLCKGVLWVKGLGFMGLWVKGSGFMGQGFMGLGWFRVWEGQLSGSKTQPRAHRRRVCYRD